MPSEVLEKHTYPGLGGGAGVPGLPGGDGGRNGRNGEGLFGDTARVGLWAFLGTVTMLFIGFTSALLLRRGSSDWQPIAAPSLLWLNTAVLVVSSLTLESARRRLRGWDLQGSERYVWTTGLLGLGFVLGQIGAWQQLAAQGVFLATNPSSSFFYLLTGVHIVHLAGGLAWFVKVAVGLRRLAYAPGEDGLSLFATYWHFLGGLWLYLLVVLFAL
jgi:cytochrome c oxidase subunit 3